MSKLTEEKISVKSVNWADVLNLVPVRNYNFIYRNSGEVDILVPRFKISFLQKLLSEKRKYMLANLDDVGSYIWELVDGVRDISMIISEARAKFGEKIEPAPERITLFLRQMHSNNFISF